MYSDTIADLLTRIRNGYMAKKTTVVTPFSKVKLAIVEKLIESGYLSAVEIIEDGHKKDLQITLLYKNGTPAIRSIQRVSKAGVRMYRSNEKLPYVLSGLGKAIISTSKGVMTADEARRQSLGGEVILKVW